MNQNNIKKSHKERKRAGNLQLEMRDVCAFYGEARALNKISISVNTKEIVAVLGSNGAGKSTLLKTLTGILPSRYGQIYFEGESITGMTPNDIIRRGISAVPEGRELFGPMSVYDNLLLGAYTLTARQRKEYFPVRLELVFSIFPVLKEKLRYKADTLSGGEQQMLALARALMSNPKLVALDEPSLGVSPVLTMEMMNLLKKISEMGISILLVEQNARAASKIADYIYIMERGEVVLEGTSQDVASDPKVYAAYLGG